MFWIVYKTTCLVNNKIYIGVHKQENPNVFDGYIGNGVSPKHMNPIRNPKFPFHFAVKKYGYKNFKRETLKIFETEEEAYAYEASIVTPEFINREDTYNFVKGGGRSHPTNGKIYQFNLDGILLNAFNCAEEASVKLGISYNSIIVSARELKARNGFLWSYTETIDISKYYIKPHNTYYIYNSSKELVDVLENRKDVLEKYNFDKANLSRAAKHGYKINGYYVSYKKLF